MTKPRSHVASAARALVAKLDVIHADREFQSFWSLLEAHGAEYTGPNYKAELEALRRALEA